jgi:putative MATE family efflux protein
MQQQILPKENKMGVMPVQRLVLTMSFPIMLSMLIQALYNIVDSIFVSMSSTLALTAVSLAFPLQNLMIAVAVGTSVGMNSLLSRKLGAKEREDAEKAAGNGLTLACISWAVFAIVGITLSKPFFRLFTQDEELIKLGATYTTICLFFSLGMFIDIMCERILQGTGDTIHSMVVQLVGAVANIILDPIMIFGLLGFPKLGIAGAAIATVLSQHISMILAIHYVKKNKDVTVTLKHLKMEKRIVKGIYAVGLPSIIMQSIGTLMTTGFNKILIAYGNSAVSVFGIYFKLQSFVFMPVFGLNSGLIPVIGYNYGAKKPERMMQALKTAVTVAVGIMAVGTLLFVLFPKTLLSWFNADADMMKIGLNAFPILASCFVFAGFSIALSGLFQGVGDGVYSMIISVTRQIVILLPSAWILSKVGGIHAIWYSFLIAELCSLMLTLFFFRKEYRKKVKPLYATAK